MTLSPRQRAVFDLVVAAALAGRRCPFNDAAESFSAHLCALARAGKVRIEVYTQNWRVVEIRDGEHTGRRTAECPHDNSGPYRVIPSAGADLARHRRTVKPAIEPLPDYGRKGWRR